MIAFIGLVAAHARETGSDLTQFGWLMSTRRKRDFEDGRSPTLPAVQLLP